MPGSDLGQQVQSLTALRDRVYAVTPAALVSLDPASGRVIATAPGAFGGFKPVLANGSIWIPVVDIGAQQLDVVRMNSTTLVVTATVALHSYSAGMPDAEAFDGRSTLFVSVGNVVEAVDLSTATVSNQFAVHDEDVTALAVDRHDDGIYVAVGTRDSTDRIDLVSVQGKVESAYSWRTGAVSGITPTAGGLWLTELTGGMGAEAAFYASRNLSTGTPATVVPADTTDIPTVDIVGSEAVISDLHGVICDDAATGAADADAAISGSSTISNLVDVSGTWLGYYRGDLGNGLATAELPVLCGS